MCEYKCKKEITRKKLINTKYKELDLLITNVNNEKELKDANKNIKELQEKVDQFPLFKASA